MTSVKNCMYCGATADLSKEDIIQKAIGGTLTIGRVCRQHNNQSLSLIDRELVSKSPIALVAAQEIGKRCEYTWDVDHVDGNVLLEAEPNAAFTSMILWPQLTFEMDGRQFRGDHLELRDFGVERAHKIFVDSLLDAVYAYNTGTKSKKRNRLWFEKIESTGPQYRYPPRVFARRRFDNLDCGVTFQCRYANRRDHRRLLRCLFDLRPAIRFSRTQKQLGSYWPSIALSYELTAVVRALVKIGLNLIEHLSCRTPVSQVSFGAAIKFVLGEVLLSKNALMQSGFVPPKDIEFLRCPKDCHKFLLVFDRRRRAWHLYCSFFGGRIGAKTLFPGIKSESWESVRITVPVGSDKWKIEYPLIHLQPHTNILWSSLGDIVPSIPLFNRQSEIRQVPVSS